MKIQKQLISCEQSVKKIPSISELEVRANGLVANSLVANSLVANGLVANGLVANSPVANSLVANDWEGGKSLRKNCDPV